MAAAAVVATMSGTLPVFLLGGLAVQVSLDLGFSSTQLGSMATTFFAVSALSSTPAGRVIERLGAYRSTATATACSALAMLGIGLLARNAVVLAAFLALGGLGNAIVQPAANLLLARGIPLGRQGLAFGVKQGAVPLASFLGGLAVPALGLTIGWRWAFLVAIIGPLSVVVLAPRIDDAPGKRRQTSKRTDSSTRALVAIAAATGTGTAAGTMLGTFLVAGAVDQGTDPSRAGLLLAVGSALGVAGRVGAGWRADFRGGGHLAVVRWMMVLGAAGFVSLATTTGDLGLLVGTVLGFGLGWGWNGLLVYAVVDANRSAPAAATGITQTGLYLGGMGGPLLFGIISDKWGFAAGWWAGATMLMIGVACTWLGQRWMHDTHQLEGRAT